MLLEIPSRLELLAEAKGLLVWILATAWNVGCVVILARVGPELAASNGEVFTSKSVVAAALQAPLLSLSIFPSLWAIAWVSRSASKWALWALPLAPIAGLSFSSGVGVVLAGVTYKVVEVLLTLLVWPVPHWEEAAWGAGLAGAWMQFPLVLPGLAFVVVATVALVLVVIPGASQGPLKWLSDALQKRNCRTLTTRVASILGLLGGILGLVAVLRHG
jgi:hypothetical protein